MVKCVVKDAVPKDERAKENQSKQKNDKETNYRLSIDPEKLATTFGDQTKQVDENIEHLTGFKTRQSFSDNLKSLAAKRESSQLPFFGGIHFNSNDDTFLEVPRASKNHQESGRAPPSVNDIKKHPKEQVAEIYDDIISGFNAKYLPETQPLPMDVSFGGAEAPVNASQLSMDKSNASQHSNRLLENSQVKKALSKMSKNSQSQVIELQLDPDQIYMRQSSQHVKQTPIQDFKKLTQVSKKRAETKPKHLQNLQNDIDDAVATAELVSNVVMLAEKSRKSRSASKKSPYPSRSRRHNNRITQAIMDESDPFESPKEIVDKDDELYNA